ncbi:MAG: MFS transporter [Xanthomonadales bacterium]|nr:MFS transporter [Xanthomonadales bacterium]
MSSTPVPSLERATGPQPARAKPELSFWQIWNMCFGFLGIQFGFALQNAQVSRIFQTLGAQVDEIAGLWVAAPLTGLIIQPIIGYCSDRTWTGLGRRRPYFLAGAILATLALLLMPNSPTLWMAAGMLWVLDSSLNITMEPFRAYVGDQLPPQQRPTGFAMQSFFIAVGSVIASILPWLFAQLGVSNTAAAGEVPDSVRYAFYLLGGGLLLAVLWTVFSTREYPPEQLQHFDDAHDEPDAPIAPAGPRLLGIVATLVGAAGVMAVWRLALDRNLYILTVGLVVFGLSMLWLSWRGRRGMFTQVMADMYAMPTTMRQLALVQFFSWFALFAMWIYTTAAVTQHHYDSTDPGSAAFNEGANWVGVLFAWYNVFAVLAALLIPTLVRRFGMRWTHLGNLWAGGAGLISILVIDDPYWLIASMIGVGFAWASILSLPYALLADALPARKMGLYMGIFNFFIVIPQLVAASVLGFVLRTAFNADPIYALVIGGASLILAGLLSLRVRVATQ